MHRTQDDKLEAQSVGYAEKIAVDLPEMFVQRLIDTDLEGHRKSGWYNEVERREDEPR